MLICERTVYLFEHVIFLIHFRVFCVIESEIDCFVGVSFVSLRIVEGDRNGGEGIGN